MGVCAGSYAAVEVALVPGEVVKAESGSMVSMSTNVHMEAKMEGSAAEAFTRCCCLGESMYLTYYSLKPGEVWRPSTYVPTIPAVGVYFLALHTNAILGDFIQ